MRKMGNLIGLERTAGAPLVPGAARLPWRRVVWVEHEVVHDELTATVEQIAQTRFALGALEHICLFDLDHRKAPALGAHAVVVLGEFLFSREKFLPLGEPFIARNDRWMWDC
jgi:hypothetical protein